MQRLLVLGLLSLMSCASNDPSREPRNAELVPGLDARLVELMRTSVETTEPHGKTPGEFAEGPPFDGSWDFHSSVIAHWALLVEARRIGDDSLESWVLDRLPETVLVETLERFLADPPKGRFLFPYDEGWFQMLLSEVARHRPSTAVLRERREQFEDRLLVALENGSYPENFGLSRRRKQAGEIRFCGNYRSLTLLALLLRWSDCVRADANDRLATWETSKLDPERERIAQMEVHSAYDFLWPPALVALFDGATNYAPPAFETWPADLEFGEVHLLGRELSEVWPCASASSQHHSDYRHRVEALLERENLWAGEFRRFSHWMPQFLYLGEWLRRGAE